MMVDREVGTTNLINKRADSFLHEANREGNAYLGWHSAHRTIIDRITLGQISELPQFPQNTHSVFEMGAYWEGAVYFIAKQLEVTSKEEFLLFLEESNVRSVYAELFYRIYDSNGQLDYFVAYIVKQYLKDELENFSDIKSRWEKCLTYFDAKNGYKYKSPQFMHKGGHYQKNPYYSGNNPLHLGLCFEHGEEKWIWK